MKFAEKYIGKSYEKLMDKISSVNHQQKNIDPKQQILYSG